MKFSPGQARVLLYLQENATDGQCYRYVREIAEATELSRIYVRQVTRQFAKWGILTYERMWELDGEETEDSPKLIPAKMALVYQWGATYYPGGNLYKIAPPEFQKALADASLCKLPDQLQLPFPNFSPYERTILARVDREGLDFSTTYKSLEASLDLAERK